MSIRDLIWVNIAQAQKLKRSGRQECDIWTARFKMAETIYLALCDCRDLAIDTNFYVRCAALKGTKNPKITGFDTKKLPSNYVEEERKEAERRAKMTPEELAEQDFKDFMAGKTIKPR